jgi:hypothetical protein
MEKICSNMYEESLNLNIFLCFLVLQKRHLTNNTLQCLVLYKIGKKNLQCLVLYTLIVVTTEVVYHDMTLMLSSEPVRVAVQVDHQVMLFNFDSLSQ